MAKDGKRCWPMVLVAAVLGCGLAQDALAKDLLWGGDTRQSRVLTVYSDGFAQVEESRVGTLPKGLCRLRLADVASGIVPESAILRGEKLSIVEMSVRPPFTDPHGLLVQSIGKTVRLVRQDPRTGEDKSENAVLLSVEPHPILRVGDRLEINHPGRIVLPITPETPMPGQAFLDFTLDNAAPAQRQLTLQYLVPGLRWQADYTAVYNEEKNLLDLSGWIGIANGSDDSFDGVSLRVVSGNVARVVEQPRAGAFRAEAKPMLVDEPLRPPMVAGYRLYPVARKVSIDAGERKQIAFLDRSAVPVARSYRVVDPVGVFRSAPGEWPRRGAFLRLIFDNTVPSGNGLPLPAGVVRVTAVRPNEADLFLGEDRIEHVPEGAPVEVQLGRVVDVAYSARRMDFRAVSRSTSEQHFNVTLFNDGEREANIELTQTFPGQWSIFDEDTAHVRRDAQTAAWNVIVPPHRSTNITFWVRNTIGN